MRTLQIKVDGNKLNDKPMRNILGMCNSPGIRFKARYDIQKKWFDELNLRYVRYHDASLENEGMQLIDVSRIFPLFHLDENDPANYFFSQTDDYLSAIADLNIEVDFRLGESIDHSGYGRLIGVPADFEKWARICKNIVAHYKYGENNGMHLNINRVTVWEEPDNDVLFGGDVDQYSNLFCAVYKLFHKEFPDIQVGGPTFCGGRYWFLERFLEVCKENEIAPDYITLTLYHREVSQVIEAVDKAQVMLDSFGFDQTKIIIAEWHLGPHSWGDNGHYKITKNGFDSAESAAFSASTLVQLMDVENLDVAFYYAWLCGVWQVATFRDEEINRYPVYFGLKFFQQLAACCKDRLAVSCDPDENLSVLAGKAEDGTVRLLVSAYQMDAAEMICKMEGASSCKMYTVGQVFDEAKCTEATMLDLQADGSVAFEHRGNGVYLLEFSV